MAALFFIDVYPYGIILRSLLRLHITQLSTHSLYLVYLEYRYPIREDDEEDRVVFIIIQYVCSCACA